MGVSQIYDIYISISEICDTLRVWNGGCVQICKINWYFTNLDTLEQINRVCKKY